MREVWMAWQEPYRDDEIRHQLEKGEARPFHVRTGVVLQFLKEPNLLRTGISDSYVEVVMLDESGVEPVIYIKPLGKCRVVASPQETDEAQLRELNELAENNPLLHRLLKVRRSRQMSAAVWAHESIMALATHNNTLQAKLVDAISSRGTAPIIVESHMLDKSVLVPIDAIKVPGFQDEAPNAAR